MDKINSFPYVIDIDYGKIDNAFKTFAIDNGYILDAIKNSIKSLLALVSMILNFIPWWLLLLIVLGAGWYLSGKLRTGVIYSVLLSSIGFFGLWQLMIETLAVIVVAVFISVLLGFPIGVLVANSDKVNSVVRPILDTMQTMPVMVYLIPAVIFFGLGQVPAVIATFIYSVVPIIRLTNHGIRQVSQEVIEASYAFGATWFQTLIKTQIPQALPTILTGLNQTIMMAMAMVVICSMIGATGLGMEILISVNRIEVGRGLFAGTAVVIVAILLDRLTQGWFKEKPPQSEVNKHDTNTINAN